jgi:hypothetical protein
MKKFDFLNDAQQPSAQLLHDYNQGVRQHYQSRQVAVSIPFWQALVTGQVVGALVGTIVMVIFANKGAHWTTVILYGFLAYLWAFLGVMLAGWIFLVRDWRKLVWTLEGVTGWDIDNDGEKGEPEQPVFPVEIKSDNGKRIQRAEFPATPWQMRDLAQGIIDGDPFTEGEWTGSGNPFSQNQFAEIRQTFIDKELAKWVNEEHHQQGVVFNDGGWQFLQKLAGYTGARGGVLPHSGNGDRAGAYPVPTQAASKHENHGGGVSNG